MHTMEAETSRRPGHRDEGGFVLVWFALLFVLMLAVVAFVVDLAYAYSGAQHAQNAADASALGAVVVMPDDATAQDIAEQIAENNGIDVSDVTVEPGSEPDELKVTIRHRVPTFFGRAIGVNSLTVTRSATAEYQAPEPLDLVMILDRTGSMSDEDLDNAKVATNAVLGFLDPSLEHVALGVLGPSSTSQQCTAPNTGAYGRLATGGDPSEWLVSPYPHAAPAADYQLADGTLNPSSQIVKTIDCLTAAGRTNLGTPIAEAQDYLRNHGRSGVRKGIILLSDGAANEPTNQSCQFAFDAATQAKAAGISIVTVGFGVDEEQCVDAGGTYPHGTSLTKLLSAMASPIGGEPADDNGCSDPANPENEDGDNFFCEPKGAGDLEAVFLQAASQLVGRSPHLTE